MLTNCFIYIFYRFNKYQIKGRKSLFNAVFSQLILVLLLIKTIFNLKGEIMRKSLFMVLSSILLIVGGQAAFSGGHSVTLDDVKARGNYYVAFQPVLLVLLQLMILEKM